MIVKQYCPRAPWDMAGIEGWLNEMAAQGYVLDRWSDFLGRTTFHTDPAAGEYRYCLDPIGKWPREDELRERIACYQDAGWRYMDKVENLYAIFRTDDPQATILYTDRESLGWAMKRMIRRQWLRVLVVLAWLAFLCWDTLFTLITAPTLIPMRLILRFESLFPLFLLLVLLAAGEVAAALWRSVRLTGIRRRLLRGEDPGPVRRRSSWGTQWVLTGLLVAGSVAVFAFSLWMDGRTTDRLPDDPAQWDFPHVTLAEMLPEGTQVREDPSLIPTHCDFRTSCLAPEQYESEQSGSALLPDGSTCQVWLSLTYAETLSPALAEVVHTGLAGQFRADWAESYRYWEKEPRVNARPLPYQEEAVSYPGLDRLIRFTYQYDGEPEPRACYVGQAGDRVFSLKVRGPDPEAALELLVRRVTEN